MRSFLKAIGIFSSPNADNYDKESCQKKMEQWCLKRGGFVALYAETFLTKEEFQQMFFDEHYKNHYEHVIREYGCDEAFPQLYEK